MRTITLAIAVAALVALAGCGSSDNTDAGGDAPPYTIVDTHEAGVTKDITVEVESDGQLRDVFDAVVADLDEDGAYFVLINCADSGTATADHRLANGRVAIGNEGVAGTGLEDGTVEFTPVDTAAPCPVS